MGQSSVTSQPIGCIAMLGPNLRKRCGNVQVIKELGHGDDNPKHSLNFQSEGETGRAFRSPAVRVAKPTSGAGVYHCDRPHRTTTNQLAGRGNLS